MRLEDDDDLKPRLPIIVYVVIGALAIIGLFSIMGAIVSGVYLLLRLAVSIAVVVLVLYALKAIFWGGRDKPERTAIDRTKL